MRHLHAVDTSLCRVAAFVSAYRTDSHRNRISNRNHSSLEPIIDVINVGKQQVSHWRVNNDVTVHATPPIHLRNRFLFF